MLALWRIKKLKKMSFDCLLWSAQPKRPQYNMYLHSEQKLRKGLTSSLSYDLSLAWMKPLALSFKIKDFLGLPQEENQPSLSGSSRAGSVGRCHDCGRARNRSTRKVRNACGKTVCPEHSKIVCLSRSQTSE